MKIKTVKPRGTTSVLYPISAGVHTINPCNEIFLREPTRKPIYKLSEKLIDNEVWHTLNIEPAVCYWLKEQDSDQWRDNNENVSWQLVVDVSDKLYMTMVLRWS